LESDLKYVYSFCKDAFLYMTRIKCGQWGAQWLFKLCVPKVN